MKLTVALAFLLGIISFVSAGRGPAPLHQSRAPAVTDEYIVVLKKDANMQSHMGFLKSELSTHKSAHTRFFYDIDNSFKGYSGRFDSEMLDDIRNRPEVDYVQPNVVVEAFGVQTDLKSWGQDRIDQADLPLDNKMYYPDSAGQDVTVYVIDTGIHISHSDFEGRAEWGADFDGSGDSDGNGHGTHCAGTIGATTYGLAKNVKLHAVKVLSPFGSGTLDAVISGINYVTEQHQIRSSNSTRKVKSVSNMSLGAQGIHKAIIDAVDASSAAGVIHVVAAGNSNADACNFSPAAAETAITVGATDRNDKLASFSNWGKCVDILAPGVDITSTWNDGNTKTISGTSMASPHVAGVAALLHEGENWSAMKEKLQKLASPDKISGNLNGAPNLLLFNNREGSGRVRGDFWKSCASDDAHLKDLQVNVVPYPPQIGKVVDVKINGNLAKTVEGGKAKLVLKVAGIPLVNEEFDICSFAEGICPIQAGPIELPVSQEIPTIAPPGKYQAHIEIYNHLGEEVTCVDADLELVKP